MDRTDEEAAELQTIWETRGCLADVADRAVEFAAARGGTMTAEELDLMLTQGTTFAERPLREHISALGSRNAVLEAEIAAEIRQTKATADALAGATDDMTLLRERLSAAEEGNRELVRRAQQAESSHLHANKTVLELRTALAEAQEQHRRSERKHANLSTAGQAGEKSAAVQLVGLAVEAGLPVRFVPQRYPCSTTCTHDDAATPGHPERVKERSEAVNAVTGAPDPVGARAVKAGAKPGREIASYRAGYEQGCDDMRAACLEATDAALAQLGITDPGVRVVLRRHIEGAAP